jgi:hypothetical protein
MACNCSVVQNVLYVVIAVLAFWPDLVGASSMIIGIAAVVLLVHQLMCRECCSTGMKKKK